MLHRREVYNEAEIAKEIDDERHDFASYKVIRIPESSNFLPAESGLQGIEIQNPDFGVKNPAKEWIKSRNNLLLFAFILICD